MTLKRIFGPNYARTKEECFGLEMETYKKELEQNAINNRILNPTYCNESYLSGTILSTFMYINMCNVYGNTIR